ncbi:chemotaxis protein CheA [Fulvimarina sp. 2208YS6-2-32]|uniref:Chemotaxis protein CheA n=1 Tax=Fulvimarina uroteuthidis TaxID=3098149 RepID=A0ABU5I0T3_9HYPH|nr:chemotaxis protein CheA [Fulvimarina sp. 2208YS6-2-32]MDY8107781.1 chemotaxis protein CheA [Fulvimarina sp. 2208YS6-2-32]
MTGMDEIRQTFFEECAEQLDELEQGLLAMQTGEADSETVHAVFRAVHSIKGGAGAFHLVELVGFAHSFETVLDAVRSIKLAASADVLAVLLRAADVLTDLVDLAREDEPVDTAAFADVSQSLDRLKGKVAGSAPQASAVVEEEDDDNDGMGDLVFEPVRVNLDELLAGDGPNVFTIVFKPFRSLYANANESSRLIRELLALGSGQVRCDQGEIPDLDVMDPEDAYLTFEIELETEAPRSAIEEIFEFVDGDCELTIEQSFRGDDGSDPDPAELSPEEVDNSVANLLAMLNLDLPKPEARVQDAEPKAASAASAPKGVKPDAGKAKPHDNDDDADVDPVAAAADFDAGDGDEHAAFPKDAMGEQVRAGAADAKNRAVPASTTIRVDLERVDRLIDLVGELVIHQVMLSQRAMQSGLAPGSEMTVGLEELEQLTRQLQDSVMAIRAQAVKSVFQKLPRLVRESCIATGKSVRLLTEGEYTEVDKTVIERLSDPLTHMIRNAIDHGVESPEDRIAAGKPAEGTIWVSAAHRSGRIVIEISDDGAGINRGRVFDIAVKKGLVPANANLSDEEIDNLIFLPGFSTKEQASELSGRGVGMDVVKQSIQSLGGRVTISSQPGLGSKFILSLPLTLAVLDGMIVTAGENTLVLPLTAVLETLKPTSSDVKGFCNESSLIRLRDQFLPVVDVARVMGFRTEAKDPSEGVTVLVETESGARQALLFDAIQGQRQVVIKSLETNYGRVEGVSAATILGDGRVALILDVDSLTSSVIAEGGARETQLVAAE